MIDDLTRPEVQDSNAMEYDESSAPAIMVDDAEEIKLTKEQEDTAVRDSTSGFPDWVANFFRRSFRLLSGWNQLTYA